jgi:predicted nucleic acid-binding protein
MIGPHDLQIAAVALGQEVATLNLAEFWRVSGFRVEDATPFRRP